jgi:hypothetical protein
VSEELSVYTKSTPTAGAIIALTGVEPRVHRRRDGVTFEFPASCEPALKKYLHGKRRADELVERSA